MNVPMQDLLGIQDMFGKVEKFLKHVMFST